MAVSYNQAIRTVDDASNFGIKDFSGAVLTSAVTRKEQVKQKNKPLVSDWEAGSELVLGRITSLIFQIRNYLLEAELQTADREKLQSEIARIQSQLQDVLAVSGLPSVNKQKQVEALEAILVGFTRRNKDIFDLTWEVFDLSRYQLMGAGGLLEQPIIEYADGAEYNLLNVDVSSAGLQGNLPRLVTAIGEVQEVLQARSEEIAKLRGKLTEAFEQVQSEVYRKQRLLKGRALSMSQAITVAMLAKKEMKFNKHKILSKDIGKIQSFR
ncbi:hypothetical protein [Polycladidibacter stylochi]|uniref:hypothetical protein n=1 Tax=Polycladidibacter stylochi TaxID=1807766 RepID=UPI0008345480|nr:hypothetical protein [Pseudovibrio stylochi]